MTDPDHACAIIRHGDAVLLEQRPLTARFAPGRFTCFGGKRESDEGAEDCLLRELFEELDWRPERWQQVVDLTEGPRFIARFYLCGGDGLDRLQALEPGAQAVWVPLAELERWPLSDWHAAVLAAWQRGDSLVDRPPRAG